MFIYVNYLLTFIYLCLYLYLFHFMIYLCIYLLFFFILIYLFLFINLFMCLLFSFTYYFDLFTFMIYLLFVSLYLFTYLFLFIYLFDGSCVYLCIYLFYVFMYFYLIIYLLHYDDMFRPNDHHQAISTKHQNKGKSSANDIFVTCDPINIIEYLKLHKTYSQMRTFPSIMDFYHSVLLSDIYFKFLMLHLLVYVCTSDCWS